MDEKGSFDSIFTSGSLQMLKVLLPCLPADKRGGFAIFIRMQELLFTMDQVRQFHGSIPMESSPSGDALFDALLPYCNSSQEEQLRQMKSMLKQMEQIKEAMEMAQMMQELFPEGMNMENMDFSQMMNLFSGRTEDDNR
ncbi:MAG: hypothetical protein IKO03_12925 [Lachnospiraceae bacterium]|nr:hypothetical protein [Lachnospiraceae bacterium]MBR3509658.1 hypothetical protein [Lachnospiraceae bacterium]MBR4607588.1 hypothetical protein [Lachnospiraceae bacterium]MBR6150662.1 hypothetical protein [Lachnospiraceae bacterium]